MFTWLAENAEAVKSVVMLIGTIVTVVVVPILVAKGKMSQKAGEAVARGVETAQGTAVRLLDDMQDGLKDGSLSTEEVAEALSKAIKRECTEQAIRSGFRSVVSKVGDMAASADGKPKRPILRRIIGL
jgi:hypothetical protein